MARSNVLETAYRIRRQLTSSFRPVQLQLLADIASGDTTVQFTSALPAGLQVGSTLGVDLELCRVLTVDTDNNQVTVLRGYMDSTPAAHTAGALVDVDARFPLLDIVEAMRTEIMSWGPQLFYVDSDTFAVPTTAQSYELPVAWADMLGVVSVLQSDDLGDNTSWPRIDCKLVRGTAAGFDGAPTSGILLRFTESIRTGSVYVVAALPYDLLELDVTLDFIDDYHLSPGMVELVELGAKKRLVTDGQYERIERQPLEPQRFGENTLLQTIAGMIQMFDASYRLRKQQEINKLRRLYPLRMT